MQVAAFSSSKTSRLCEFVFRRADTVQSLQKAPYSGPHQFVRRIDDRTFVVDVNGVIDDLKPTYLGPADATSSSAPFHSQPVSSATSGAHSPTSTSILCRSSQPVSSSMTAPTVDDHSSSAIVPGEITAASYFAIGAVAFTLEAEDTSYSIIPVDAP